MVMRLGEQIYDLYLKPWYEGLENPAKAQEEVLRRLLEGYKRTKYGRDKGASNVSGREEFREVFPKTSYQDLKPYLERVMEGDYNILLPEPPITWAMTRGSTGPPKIIPLTETHLREVRMCGARALLNYALRKREAALLEGGVLNLNLPSQVERIEAGGRIITYGYSSGTYAKVNPSLGSLSLVPRQEEIDGLGGGITIKDWRERFELVYERSKDVDIRFGIGVTPVMVSFARYLKRRHGVYPKDLWRIEALFCTSVAKIHQKYSPILKALYGGVDVVEIYSATEGVYGQQLDDFPYISPNYDVYYLEVETGKEVKMLYEMRRGEWGRIIISSTLFPRYDIGDMVECMGKYYYRIFGRARLRTILEHRIYRALTKWFI